MVNKNNAIQPNTTEHENPLRRWRQQVEPPLTLDEAARRANVAASAWWSWEQWPSSKGKMPRPENWPVLSKITNGAVTANDFIDLMSEAA